MGMDVYGKNPTNEAGKYFRNNVWWWRPLATYILETAPQSITSQCEHWGTNDGDGLDAERSSKLADFLRSQIAFAIGLRGGDFNTLTPSFAIDPSRCFAKIQSRS